MNTLKAEKRTMDTKAKRLRREGYVTGNVFGREMEGSLPVKIEKNDVHAGPVDYRQQMRRYIIHLWDSK